MVVAEDRESDVEARRNAPLDFLGFSRFLVGPEDVIVNDLRKRPTVEDETLTHEGEGARQHELARVLGIYLEPLAANVLFADVAFEDALVQCGQRVARDVAGRDTGVGETDADLAEIERIRLADQVQQHAIELLPALLHAGALEKVMQRDGPRQLTQILIGRLAARDAEVDAPQPHDRLKIGLQIRAFGVAAARLELRKVDWPQPAKERKFQHLLAPTGVDRLGDALLWPEPAAGRRPQQSVGHGQEKV